MITQTKRIISDSGREFRMIRKSAFVLLLVFLCLWMTTASALNNGIWEYRTERGNVVLTGYFGAERIKKLEFPAEIDDKPVTIIGSGNIFVWLNEVGQRTELVFPDTVEEIRGEFFTLGNFGKVIIPASVKKIGDNAFSIAAVSEFEFKGAPETMGNRAFAEIYPLKSIKIPQGTLTLGKSCFEKCDRLTSVELPASLTSIGEKCFSGDVKLSTVKFAPGCSITEIPLGCFIDCAALKSIELPETVTSIGTNAFYGCKSLTSVVIPEGVTKIAGDAFSNCSSKLVLTVSSDSYAHQWATEKGLKTKVVTSAAALKKLMDTQNSTYRTLKPGVSGTDVLAARTKLYELGYFSKQPTQTEYTNNMKDYVKKFEKDNGLKQDGILSPEDQALLFSL